MAGGKAPRAAGDRFERACVERLRAVGYLVVRSAGSLGPCDLVALRGDRVPVLVQCKRTDNLTRAGRVALWNVGQDYAATVVVASKPGRGRAIRWDRITDTGAYTPYDIDTDDIPRR